MKERSATHKFTQHEALTNQWAQMDEYPGIISTEATNNLDWELGNVETMEPIGKIVDQFAGDELDVIARIDANVYEGSMRLPYYVIRSQTPLGERSTAGLGEAETTNLMLVNQDYLRSIERGEEPDETTFKGVWPGESIYVGGTNDNTRFFNKKDKNTQEVDRRITDTGFMLRLTKGNSLNFTRWDANADVKAFTMRDTSHIEGFLESHREHIEAGNIDHHELEERRSDAMQLLEAGWSARGVEASEQVKMAEEVIYIDAMTKVVESEKSAVRSTIELIERELKDRAVNIIESISGINGVGASVLESMGLKIGEKRRTKIRNDMIEGFRAQMREHAIAQSQEVANIRQASRRIELFLNAYNDALDNVRKKSGKKPLSVKFKMFG